MNIQDRIREWKDRIARESLSEEPRVPCQAIRLDTS
jgi:hypothetical protein